jgi:hypothetical protein
MICSTVPNADAQLVIQLKAGLSQLKCTNNTMSIVPNGCPIVPAIRTHTIFNDGQQSLPFECICEFICGILARSILENNLINRGTVVLHTLAIA